MSTYQKLDNLGVESIIAFPYSPNDYSIEGVNLLPIEQKYRLAISSIEKSNYVGTPKDTIFISHGTWKLPTLIGAYFKSKGYKWVAIPHGMLEPWSMSYHWYFKYPYYLLIEKPRLKKADILVGVSSVEAINLSKTFDRVVHIPNAISPNRNLKKKSNITKLFVFIGRLHSKKGVVELAKAWLNSRLNNNCSYRLMIVGPDEGEEKKLKNLCLGSKNIILSEPIYGKEKISLLEQSHFFLLPSHSEGLPTSVLEAMTCGCIPLISRGCNFPEAFEANVAIETPPKVDVLQERLEDVANWPITYIRSVGAKAKKFVDSNFDLDNITKRYYELYDFILKDGEKG